jgi:hypothetical protein
MQRALVTLFNLEMEAVRERARSTRKRGGLKLPWDRVTGDGL